VHWIIGTAGHIDHGKTSLIKALTGQDTDRLKEEKERGISIDLGFAYFDLPDRSRAGVVDVPGHERFIRNMLAGAHGIDLVLFTVAADDGVMPQTREHLDILHLLRVSRAVFVITKTDRATPARIAEVADDIRLLILETSLDGSPIVPFSAVTGEGLAVLRNRIAEHLAAGRKPIPDGYFRLPVDRAFVSAGHGLIVTGTAVSGEVRTGESVRCLPGGDTLRVRSIEVHNASVATGMWGQRLALNLAAPARVGIARGDVICHEKITLVSSRFDARIEVRPSAASGLKHHQRVRVHLGTAERIGKVVALGSLDSSKKYAVSPGESAFCQIALTEPLITLKGDRFILRDETAQRTIGGGIVIRPAAAKHRRGEPGLLARLASLEGGNEAALIGEGGEFAVSLTAAAQLLNRREEDVKVRLAASDAIHAFNVDGDAHFALEQTCRRVKAALLAALGSWHSVHPLATGMDLEEARTALRDRVPVKIFRMLVEEMVADRAVVREGSALRLPEHRIAVPENDRALVDQIRTLLQRTPLSPPDVKQLTAQLTVDRVRLIGLLRALEKQRELVAVSADLYFPADSVKRVREDLIRWLSTKDAITPAEFRDQYQTSRKYVIPLLEYFDREGVTVRMGEVRRLKRPRLTETA
jgi:selenocysteine-specific elongation factor